MTQSPNTPYPSSMYIVRKDQAFQDGVRQALVLLDTEYGNPDCKQQYYLVSETSRLEHFISETLIFECDMNGKVKDYQEVGGSKLLTLEDVLSDFESFLNK